MTNLNPIAAAGIQKAGSREQSMDMLTARDLRLYRWCLAASISLWFLAIRAPLWLDETSSYWQISAGFRQIAARQGISFAAYSYILWLWSLVFGTSEIALRIPSILAMLGAVYLLYRAACEFFDRDIAFIVAIVFSIHPVVIFAAIDVRPYAFAVLAINAAIFCVVCLRNDDSNWLAAAFGVSTALILYFQTLFGVILLPLLICFFVLKKGESHVRWRQLGISLGAFTIAMAPVIATLKELFTSGHTLVFLKPPGFGELFFTIMPRWSLFIYAVFLIFAAATQKPRKDDSVKDPRILVCALLGLFPILVLYILSVKTPLQVFVPRYRLVAIPGIALCWGFLVSLFNSRTLRGVFCIVLLAANICQSVAHRQPHGYSWKNALRTAEKSATVDGAPVVICSDFPQSDYTTMPVDAAVKDSSLFTPLSYYKLSVPVVGLPRALNDEAIRDGQRFLQTASQERFLALGFSPSYPTLEWLIQNTAHTHTVRQLGKFDDIKVLEFTPLAHLDVK